MRILALGLILLTSAVFTGTAWAQVPQSKHVWVLTEENHSYEAVIGNSGMPYFNSLVAKYGLATQYYSEQHNSLSALMWLVAGQPVTSNDSTTSCYNVNNIARQLIAQGYRWRAYQEDLPYAGFAGISYANYVRRHNPMIDFTDVCAVSQKNNSVPYTQLATDIINRATPNYAYITPNLAHDAHNGTLAAADTWLSEHLPAILALPEFQPGGDGILFVVFDEADLSGNGGGPDNRCSANISNGCGGHLATLIIGPQVKPGYQSPVRYDHANLLSTVCAAMGLSSCPAAASVARPMTDFFNTVSIATPFPNANAASPVHIQATTSNSSPVKVVQIYVDGLLKYQVSGSSVNTNVPMSAGHHFVVVQAWDTAGGIHKRGIYVNVQSEAVVVSNPAPSSLVAQSVQVGASAGGTSAVKKMQLYVDGISQFQSSGNTLQASVSLSAGSHTLAVEASDASGNLTTNKFPVTSVRPTVKILSPASNASFYSPMYLSAVAVDSTPAQTSQVYVDNNLVYQVTGTGVQAQIPVAVGKHSVTVKESNASGVTHSNTTSVDVLNVPITISSPKANATVSSSVTIKASAPSSSPVQTMQIYIDNALKSQASGQTISHTFSLSSGKHYIVAKGWDGGGNNWYTGEYITVN